MAHYFLEYMQSWPHSGQNKIDLGVRWNTFVVFIRR